MRGLPWFEILSHAWVSLGEGQFFFTKWDPPTRGLPWCETPTLVTTASALVKHFVYQSLKNPSTPQNYPICCNVVYLGVVS